MKAKFLMSPAFATFLICVPLRPIPATAQPYAYVADSNSASVKVIDTKTVSTVATVSSGLFRELQFVAITPDGAYAYITDRNAGAVMVIDTTLASTTPNSAVVATVPVGKLPEGVAITPDGAYAYVANGGSSTISVIDTAKALTDASHAIVATVLLSTGSTPLGVAITPDGSRAYVTDTSSNQVLVIDTKRALTSPATGVVAVVTLLVNSLVQPLPAYPALVAIAPDGQRVYVTLNNSDSLAVIDTASQMQQYFGGSTICLDFQSGTCEFSGFPVKVGSPSWSSALAVSPDGSRVYVAFHTDRSTDPARSPNRMSVVQVATLQATNTIPVGGVPTVAAITPDGAQLYVTNQGDGTVSLINTAAAIAVSTPID
ncbi:MAG TPA: beta-propeller fold lactonase family protein, partial [Bryobacteraceae bacterium]